MVISDVHCAAGGCCIGCADGVLLLVCIALAIKEFL